MNFRTIGVGDYAPNSVFADQNGQPVSPVEIPYAGALTAVAVLRDAGNANVAAFLGALKAQASQFEAAGALLVAALAMPATEHATLRNGLQPGFAMLADANGECAASFGLTESAGAGLIAILDRNSHVIAKLTGLPGVAPVADALAVIGKHQSAETDSANPGHAPVLLIPRLFEAELCRNLMDFGSKAKSAATR